MTPSLADNPIVVEPRKHLTQSQQDGLLAVCHFKHHRRIGPEIHFGKKRFKLSTIATLEKLDLIRFQRASYEPTLAGQLAAERLRGGQP